MRGRSRYFIKGTRLVFLTQAERNEMADADREFQESLDTCYTFLIYPLGKIEDKR